MQCCLSTPGTPSPVNLCKTSSVLIICNRNFFSLSRSCTYLFSMFLYFGAVFIADFSLVCSLNVCTCIVLSFGLFIFTPLFLCLSYFSVLVLSSDFLFSQSICLIFLAHVSSDYGFLSFLRCLLVCSPTL